MAHLETEWKNEQQVLGKMKEQPGSIDRMILDAAFDRYPWMKRAHRARQQFQKSFALKSRQMADAAPREWEGSLYSSIAPIFEDVTRAWRTGKRRY